MKLKTQMRNTKNSYGIVARLLHWVMAIVIFGMFALGLWMHNLSFYSPWYHTAPNIHKSIGILLFFTLIARIVWRLINPKPDNNYLKPFERKVSHLVHWAMYVILFVLMATGYLISTLGGRSVSVFDLFDVPSVFENKALEKLVGFSHELIAFCLIGLVVLHAAAALKHHFIDGDVTLKRKLSPTTNT